MGVVLCEMLIGVDECANFLEIKFVQRNIYDIPDEHLKSLDDFEIVQLKDAIDLMIKLWTHVFTNPLGVDLEQIKSHSWFNSIAYNNFILYPVSKNRFNCEFLVGDLEGKIRLSMDEASLEIFQVKEGDSSMGLNFLRSKFPLLDLDNAFTCSS